MRHRHGKKPRAKPPALPLMLLSLAALSGEHHRSPTRTATAPASIRSSPAGFLMSTAIAWAIILVDVAVLSFAAERDVHRGREGALAHVPLVTNVAVARVIDAG